jgi:hypothetical protein
MRIAGRLGVLLAAGFMIAGPLAPAPAQAQSGVVTTGVGYWWPYDHFRRYPVLVYDRPTPLWSPSGYYGYFGVCRRQPVWRGGHWHSVILC